MRCIALFHAMMRQSRSNAKRPSTLASSRRVKSDGDSFSKLFRRWISIRNYYFAPVSNIKPVASRTRMFEPNNTGIEKVDDSDTS